MAKQKNKQNGAALLIFVMVILLAGATFLFSVLDGSSVKIERDKKTAAALAEAKAALIGFALKNGTATGAARPGDLPCPDTHAPGALEGQSSTPCAADVIGRLPWRTLGLPDLRDGDGERLWYAVSSTFKNNPRTPILNSDTFGTITLRDSAGVIIESAAIAVVIAPGGPLTRQDGVVQNHVVANYNIANHYLDNFDSADNSRDEDNSDFAGGSTNGFINGIIKDASDNVIVNDRVITVNYNDLMPIMERRVASEVKKSLNNIGGLPWAAVFMNPSLSNNNFVPANGINGGLLPVFPHYWDITDASNPVSSYVTRSGTVAIADLTSGFVEPGFCSQVGAQAVCSGRKKVQGDTAWRDLSINVTATFDSSNSFTDIVMAGGLTITDTRISDGVVLGMGSVTPTASTKISISPQRSTLFPLWLTANNWHHLVYFAIATPFTYGAASPPVCGPCLSVNYNGGLMSNIGSLVMVAGKRLDATLFQAVPQNRPSGNLYDYYDTFNNQAGGATFDWDRTLTSTFNDQLVIVAQ